MKKQPDEQETKSASVTGPSSIFASQQRQIEAGAWLAAIVESSDDAIVTKSLEGVIGTWNKAAERMFGYTAEEAIGRPITLLIPSDRLDEELEILDRLKRGERIEHFETIRRRKDGTLLDISLSISPLRDGTGQLVGASKIARDITQRKQMERALQEETRMLELLNETGNHIASQLELQGLLQRVTDSATRLSGAQFGAFFYNVADEKGESFSLYTLSGAPREAFDKFGMPRNTEVFGPTFRGERVVRSDDITADPRYGKMSPHYGMPKGHLPVRSYLAVPVTSRSGEVIGGLFFGHSERGIFTERSERLVRGVAAQAGVAIDNARLYEEVKRSAQERQQLLEAERAARSAAERISLVKDEFLATLSHELRTPLTAILGWARMLRSGARNEKMLQEGLEVIERNSALQTRLIEDLLDMSRIISGKVRLEVEQVKLEEVLNSAIASVQISADAKGISITKVMDPSVGTVRGDPARLQQCFWNLLTNAVKFTGPGGRIQVCMVPVNGQVRISVEDNGRGIDPILLPHLFERFRQAESSTTRHHGGLGLGLSIVKHLVELHGGAVGAHSGGEGLGATFTVDLPVALSRKQAQTKVEAGMDGDAEMSAPYDLSSLEGITILVVDDEPDARSLLKRLLELCGATVVLAESAAEGLQRVLAVRPHMIISDIGMPGEDGYEFIRKVRGLKPEEGGRTPAAALTAFARAEDRTRALKAGFQTHVIKPVEPTELTAVVASLAQRR